MFSIKSRWITFVVAASFTVLQALQPFIHAHLDTDHPIHNSGFHIGSNHEEALNTQHLADHTTSSVAHASHTISVDSSIKQDADSTLLTNTILALVFIFCFILALQTRHLLNFAFLLIPKESLRRRLPASRAPPQI